MGTYNRKTPYNKSREAKPSGFVTGNKAAILQDNRTGIADQAKTANSTTSKTSAPELDARHHLVDNRPLQKKANNTGLPGQLKTGIENLSGHSLDDVKVHYNSPKPAQLQALAYAQGNQIHVAPGQEKHLPHEAWHVVQQKQGRVKPTLQMKTGVAINDDIGLEKEADVMGQKASQVSSTHPLQQKSMRSIHRSSTFQLVKKTHQQKIDDLNAKIKKANDEIKKLHNLQDAFVTDSTFTPMNPAVYHGSIDPTNTLEMTKEQARFANFSALIKGFINSTAKNPITPEVQTASVFNTSGIADSVYVSGNSERANKKIRPKGKRDVKDFYTDDLRPLNIKNRQEGMLRHGALVHKTKKERLRFFGTLKMPATPKGKKVDKNVVKVQVLKGLYRDNRRTQQRLKAKSARKFSKYYGTRSLVVPDNKLNIHAESAILKKLREVKMKIDSIGGTKVACMACFAFFASLKEEHHLGSHVGYGWISESSIKQLKSIMKSVNDASTYLQAIHAELKKHLNKLKFFKGAGGEKKAEDMEVESDIDDSDSEDEDAVNSMPSNAKIDELVDEYIKTYYK